ncbi:M90 family metallopeptidase [Xylophilus sp. GW821-FHT01B05]
MIAAMWHRLRALLPSRRAALASGRTIPDALWDDTLAQLPFLQALTPTELQQLRRLAAAFLDQKEFHGAHGLAITDAMALSIAVQACLPLLHFGPAAQALGWYDDFVMVVVHAAEVVAPREVTDDIGVVHHYDEPLVGEAMERGPVTLSWQDVAAAGERVDEGTNVVVHEFIHKMDMRDGAADGCPPLPRGFLGTHSSRAARAAWHALLEPAYQAHREQVIIAERFGGATPWLDAYGAEALEEFFPVACEAYFVNRARFAQEFPTLPALFDAFFRPGTELQK